MRGPCDLVHSQFSSFLLHRSYKSFYHTFRHTASKEGIQGYRSLAGALLWVAGMTRPDIAIAVGKCNRYASNPTPTHDLALKRIVLYLAGS